MEPTIKLSDEQRLAVGQAQAALRAGKKLSGTEQGAVNRWKEYEAQRAFCELCGKLPVDLLWQLLGVDAADGRKLLRKIGVTLQGKTIDLPAVLSKLAACLNRIDAARLAVAASGGIARTWAEAAVALGVGGADPVRTVHKWAERGMPCEPGQSGKRTGRFVIDECRAWIAANVGRVNGDGDESTAEIQRRIVQLDLELRERDKLESLGRLADVDEVAAFAAGVVANAKAILEGLPDELVGLLPPKVGGPARKEVTRRAAKRIETALRELARMIAGDTDETDDPEDEDD